MRSNLSQGTCLLAVVALALFSSVAAGGDLAMPDQAAPKKVIHVDDDREHGRGRQQAIPF